MWVVLTIVSVLGFHLLSAGIFSMCCAKGLLPHTFGTCCRTYQASRWPVEAAYLLGLNCCFPAYLELGTHLGALLPTCLWIPPPNKFLCPESPVS